MPPVTQEQQDDFHQMFSSVPFTSLIQLGKHLVDMHEIDEFPPIDKNGYRRLDGFKVSYVTTVLPGVFLLPPCLTKI
jgi:hypothetical protein